MLSLTWAVAAEAVSPQVSAGIAHTCALLPSGRVDCWGEGFYGELGDGVFQSSTAAVEVAGIATATSVSAGGLASCAALLSGHVECWGWNEAGQLGNGTKTNSPVPVEVQTVSTATQVSAGERHACALLENGHVDCWGDGEQGQLGDDSLANSPAPVEVQGITDATQISSGGAHTCAVLSTGHIECWGRNGVGELGNGSNSTTQDTPVEVQGITNATSVSGGWEHTCALLTTSHVDCWGANFYGQIGNGGPGRSNFYETPQEVKSLTGAIRLSAGWYHTCAVLTGGAIECWGSNQWGQLGNGTLTNSNVPTSVNGIGNATAVASGEEHTCAALSSGHIDCWGRNYWDQLGNGTTANSNVPVEAQDLTNATAAVAGSYHTCGILSTGHVQCWGNNEYGELGNASTTDTESPVEVQGPTNAALLAAGEYHSCAVLTTGHIDCWGDNFAGQLGDGTSSGPNQCELPGSILASCAITPVEVQAITTATAIAAGNEHTCAVLASGHVECWGQNSYGQLGNGTTTTATSPVEASRLVTASDVAGGGSFTCAVLTTGRVECWGRNGAGQLGNGTATNASTPVEVTGLTSATQVATGWEHSCALLTSGHIDCWGDNFAGQLGNGTNTNAKTPVEVQGVTNATAVAAAGEHTCALLSTAHVVCWGLNSWGQLGNASNSNSNVPVAVQGLTSAAGITAGGVGNVYGHTCAVLTSGHVECWGLDFYGQLGSGTTWSTMPTEVLGVSWAAAPIVITGAASSIAQTSATLNATVNPEDGTVTNCEFAYGTSPTYGTTVPCASLPGSGTEPVAVSANVAALTANTTYHYRIVTTNDAGTSIGNDATFETAGPEFGRCLKLSTASGQFTNSVCTKPAGTMKYEWYPSAGSVKPLEHPAFTTAIKPKTTIRLETSGKRLVSCTGESGAGVYSATKVVGSTQLRLTGCHQGASGPCSSEATSGEIVTALLTGTLGVIKTSTEGPLKNKIGLALSPAVAGPLAEFVCGDIAYILTGAVIAEVSVNVMQLNTGVWKLTQTKGVQKPIGFEGRPPQILQLRVSGNGPEQAGLSLSMVVSNEEQLETNTVM